MTVGYHAVHVHRSVPQGMIIEMSVIVYVFCSSYPDKRVKKDDKGREMGVVGSVSLLQNVTLASQPISHVDWNPDKVNSSTPDLQLVAKPLCQLGYQGIGGLAQAQH